MVVVCISRVVGSGIGSPINIGKREGFAGDATTSLVADAGVEAAMVPSDDDEAGSNGGGAAAEGDGADAGDARDCPGAFCATGALA